MIPLITQLTAYVDEAQPTTETTETTEATMTTESDPMRGSCPDYAPIKGNLAPYTAEYCIFHAPDGLYICAPTPGVALSARTLH